MAPRIMSSLAKAVKEENFRSLSDIAATIVGNIMAFTVQQPISPNVNKINFENTTNNMIKVGGGLDALSSDFFKLFQSIIEGGKPGESALKFDQIEQQWLSGPKLEEKLPAFSHIIHTVMNHSTSMRNIEQFAITFANFVPGFGTDERLLPPSVQKDLQVARAEVADEQFYDALTTPPTPQTSSKKNWDIVRRNVLSESTRGLAARTRRGGGRW